MRPLSVGGRSQLAERLSHLPLVLQREALTRDHVEASRVAVEGSLGQVPGSPFVNRRWASIP